MDMTEAEKLLTAFLNKNKPVLIEGASGAGKSDLVAQVAAKRGAILIDERLSSLESIDMRGVAYRDGSNVQWARPIMFQKVDACEGKPCILFLDEITSADRSVMATLYQLYLNRRIGEHALPDNCQLVGAGNLASDKGVTNPLPGPLANRMGHLTIDVSVKAWRMWANGIGGISPVLSAFIAMRGEGKDGLLHKIPDGRVVRAFPSPRSWANADAFTHDGDDIRPGAFRALVGETAASEFEAFYRSYGHIPSFDAIVADPNGAPVPPMSEPALIWALAGMCGAKATRQNFASVLAYAGRLPRDFSVMCATDAVRRDATLLQTRAWIDWAVSHQDVTI